MVNTVKIAADSLELFEEYARKRKAMGSPLIESNDLSERENATIRRINAEPAGKSHDR